MGDVRHTRRWRESTVPRILRRDGGVCHICGAPGADSADHLIPKEFGGTDDDDNLAAVHHKAEPRCNLRRGSATIAVGRARVSKATAPPPAPKVSRQW